MPWPGPVRRFAASACARSVREDARDSRRASVESLIGTARRPKSVRPAPQLYSAEQQPYQCLDIGDAVAKSRATLLSGTAVDARRPSMPPIGGRVWTAR